MSHTHNFPMPSAPLDRRREPRYPIACSASVETDRTEATIQLGRFLDVSDRGARLQLGELPWAPGEAIRIRVQDAVIGGKVRYSFTEGTLYTIGVELDEPLSDSQMKAILVNLVDDQHGFSERRLS